MIEIIIERWTNPDRTVDFRWSIWRDGRRVQMGDASPTAESSESEALEYCRRAIGRAPDRVTRL